MQLRNIGNFTDVINKGKELGSMLVLSAESSKILEDSLDGLSSAQILSKVNTMGLTDAQKLELIQLYALDSANYQSAASLGTLSATETTATATTTGLSAAFTGLKTVLTPILPLIGAIITAFAAYKFWDWINLSYDEARDNLSTASSNYQETADELKSLSSELETTTSRLEELRELESQGNLTLTDQAELEKLERQNEALQKQLEIKQKLAEIQQREQFEAAKTVLDYKTDQIYKTDENGNVIADENGMTIMEEADRFDILEEKLRRYTQAKKDYAKAQDEFSKAETDFNNNEISKRKFENIRKNYEDKKQAVEDYESEISSGIKDLSNDIELLYDSEGNLIKGGEEYVDRFNEISDAFNNIDLSPAEKALKKLERYFDGSFGKNAIKKQLQDAVDKGEDLESTLNQMGLTLDDLGIDNVNQLASYFQKVKDSTEEATKSVQDYAASVSDISKATESEDIDKNWSTVSSAYKTAKELLAEGKTGVDDFQTVAAFLNPQAVKKYAEEGGKYTADAYQKAFEEIKATANRWFGEDEAVSMKNFVNDFKTKGLFDVTTDDMGLWDITTNFETTAQAADKFGMSIESVETMLKALEAYGYDFSGITFSTDNLKEYEEYLNGIEEVYESLDDSELKNEIELDKSKLEKDYEYYKEHIDELTEPKIQEIKFKYDIASLKSKINEIQNAWDNGDRSATTGAELIASKMQLRETYESQTGYTEKSGDKGYTGSYTKINDLQSQFNTQKSDEAREKIQEEINAIVELQNAFQGLQASGVEIDWDTFLNSKDAGKVFDELVKQGKLSKEELANLFNMDENGIDASIDAKVEFNKKEIEEQINALKENETITFTANVDDAEEKVQALKNEDGTITYTLETTGEELELGENGEFTVKVKAEDEASDVIENISQKEIEDKVVMLTGVDDATPYINLWNIMSADPKFAKLSAVDQATLVVDTYNKLAMENKTSEISQTGGEVTQSVANAVKSAIENIPNTKNISIGASITKGFYTAYNYVKNAIATLNKGMSTGGVGGYQGTAHYGGTAHVRGSIPSDVFTNPKYRTKDDEVTLTGEEDQEIVVHGNEWWTVGDKGAEFSYIPSNSIVFNGKQTKELLSKGYTNSRGKAHLHGTAYRLGNDTTSTANSKNASSSSSKTSTSSKDKDSSSNSDTEEKFEETLDLVKIYLERQERRTEKLVNAIDDAVGLIDKQAATNKAISQVQAEISANQKAYNTYKQKADAVDLSSDYKNKIINGQLSIETITDESLNDSIQEFQQWYDEMLACEDKIDDLKDKLKDLAQTKFDNVTTEFENQISLIEHETKMLESTIDLIESQGYIVTRDYYDNLIKQEEENYNKLQSEYKTLTDTLNDLLNQKLIEKYSDQWYDMTNSINEVSEAILDSQKALVEYENAIRDLEWDFFDKTQDMLSQIQAESDFLVELMSNDKMYDSETGKITEKGQATLGLHAVNYNAYMSQADDYAKEIAKIDKELADDPNNQTLLERRQELLETQRDMIKSAEDEKQAIKDLVSDGYDAFLEIMQKAINKRKELLTNIKDLYDYEKNIAEQTKEISALEKQLNAYQGDTSEEAKSTIQQLKVSLEEAKKNLEETEYDKYISDQEQLLDNLYDQTQEFFNARLDNLELIIQNVIDSTNENSESIKETLTNEAASVGTTLSDAMNAIWSPDGTYTSVVTTYGDNFSSLLTTTNSTLTTIRKYVAKMAGITESEENTSKPSTPKPSTPNTDNSSNNSTNNNTSSSSSGKWGSWFISKKDSYPKNKLDKDKSIVDRLRYFDYDFSMSARAKYYKAMGKTDTYTGSATQNQWMLSEMKKNGFKKGGTIGSLIKRTGEDGYILARTGEEILSLDKIDALKDTFITMDSMFKSLVKLPEIPQSQVNNGNVTNEITFHFELPNVRNADDFVNALQNDKRCEKIIQQMTLGAMTGKNSLLKYNY